MFKRFINSTVFLVLAAVLPVWASNPPEQELAALSVIAQAVNTKPIWPAYDLASDPTIITFKNGHVYALNLNSSDSAWTTLDLGNTKVQYSEKDLWNVTSAPMMANFPIEHHEAFVFQIDLMQQEGTLPYLVFVHERFHRHQFRHFVNNLHGPTHYEDHLNVENLALLQLEEKILKDYLLTQDKDILRDFMAVNKTRRNLMHKASVMHELDQQKMEGLADYVSVKLFDEYRIQPKFNGREHLMKTLETYIKNDHLSERAMKWRHYGVGATLGYALDDLQVTGWKEKVQQEGAYQVLLLEEQLALSQAEIEERLAQVKAAYDYQAISSSTQSKIENYNQYLLSLEKDYESLPGISLTVGQAKRSGQTGGGTTAGIIYLSDGSALSIGDDSFAASLDNQWRLRLNKIPYVYQGRGGEKTFKVEEELVIYLDNKAHTLKDIKGTLAFHTLSWKGKQTEFISEEIPGQISLQDNRVVIDF